MQIRTRTIPLTRDAIARLGGSAEAPPIGVLATSLRVEPVVEPCNFSTEWQLPDPVRPRDFADEWQRLRDSRHNWTKDDVRNHAVASQFYELYKQLGIDPRRNPPSAANLLMRFVIGERCRQPLPNINSVVNAGNVVQAETLVPIAIFDADAVGDDMILDVARDGDILDAFGFDQPEPVDPSRLVLRDSQRVLSEFCYRDGKAQAVGANTRNLHILACRAGNVDESTARSALERVVELIGTCHRIQ